MTMIVDLKLKNVFVKLNPVSCELSRVSLADLGLSLSLTRDAQMLSTSRKRGTRGYKAPELDQRWNDEPLTTAIDIYSFGKVVEKLRSRLSDMLMEEPNAELDYFLDSLRRQCVNIDPGRRSTARQLWAQIRDAKTR